MKTAKTFILNNITKKYKDTIVFQDCSLDFSEFGNIIGLIGENGCGKTTLFKLISGLAFVDEGEILNSYQVSKLIENPGLINNKTGLENLEYFLNNEEYKSSIEYVELFLMNDYIQNKVKTYSSGMKQKLALVLVLSLESEVILLDEPTISLDVQTVSTLISLVKELSKTKRIIISTHDIPLWFSVFDDVLVFKDYKLHKTSISDLKLVSYLLSLRDLNKFKEDFPHLIDDYSSLMNLSLNEVVITFHKENHDEVFKELVKYGLLKALAINQMKLGK